MKINSNGISELANNSITTTLVEGRIGTDYIDWQLDGSILLKNRVKLGGSGIRVDETYDYITDNWLVLDTVAAYASSGSFTVPSGVTIVWVLLVGGGGGGSGGYAYSVTTGSGDTAVTTTYQVGGRAGGDGGAGLKKLSVSPGNVISFTIGAGANGAGTNGNGGTGGNSSLTFGGSTLTANGGTGGTVGTAGSTGSTGAVANETYNMAAAYTTRMAIIQAGTADSIYDLEIQFSNPFYDEIRSQSVVRTTGTTAAVAYSYAGSYKMGANGNGASAYGQAGSGGVGGGAFFFYKAP